MINIVLNSCKTFFIFCFIFSLPSPSDAQSTKSFRYFVPYVDMDHKGKNNTYNRLTIFAFNDCTELEIEGQRFSLAEGEKIVVEKPLLKPGMLIISNSEIQVQVFFSVSHYQLYEDGAIFYSLLEESSLGVRYRIPIPNKEISLVATKDGTEISINGASIGILQQGEVRKFPSVAIGTEILATHPIAVVAVNFSTDHYNRTYATQLIHYDLLGKEYFVPKSQPFSLSSATNNSGIYITSITDNTIVNIEGTQSVLQKGEHIFHSTTEAQEVKLTSNNPVYTVFLNSINARDVWGRIFREYQYAFSLSSMGLQTKEAVIEKLNPDARHGYPQVQVAITSFTDNNLISFSTNQVIQETVTLQKGQTYYLHERQISGWANYPLRIVSTEAIQAIHSIWGRWNNLSESAYGDNVIGVKASPDSKGPGIELKGPFEFCEGGKTMLKTDYLAEIYKWYWDGEPIGSNIDSICVTQEGRYTLQIENACGSTIISPDTVHIIVKSLPDAPQAKDEMRCGEGSLTLEAFSATADEYRWYEHNDHDTTQLQGQTLNTYTTPILTGSMKYFVTSIESKCESELMPVKAIIIEPPVVDAGEDQIIKQGESAQLQGSGSSNNPLVGHEWIPSSFLDDPFISDPIATPDSTVSYILEVEDDQGCIGFDEVTITVTEDNKPSIPVPRMISPNNDGVNDLWILKNIENYPNIEISIVDRWGKEVFRSRGYSKPWDGTYNGKPLPIDAYYYVIILSDQINPITGYVAIVK
ncbi:gliding motility-associated C-terminal domain-containing protein [Fulvivirgaceae bacterium BMA10]|uniref:Gliding motility-associated C-terminal domain-containing protein n=1 Tax=Splendidivirga corallicola TaxID=3051826 RepID=A0ABT8KUR8_9BACT|nr:gliding motility-associated C-terminal domain-containing protein [Fulvivirgaceae bacterium BMA10]